VYLIRVFINLLSFPPIPGADDSNHTFPDGESDCHDTFTNLPDTVIPFLSVAVLKVSQDDTIGIQEGMLGDTEDEMVLSLIFKVFGVIPIEPDTLHIEMLALKGREGNIKIWHSVWLISCPNVCVSGTPSGAARAPHGACPAGASAARTGWHFTTYALLLFPASDSMPASPQIIGLMLKIFLPTQVLGDTAHFLVKGR
jgi:hypothetical protein